MLARWQEFVGTGELLRALESKVGRLRDRVTAAVKGKPQPGDELAVAVESGLETLILEHAEDGGRAGRHGLGAATRPGAQLLGDDDLAAARPGSAEATARAVRDWQAGVLDLVRSQGQTSGPPRASSPSASTGSA